jgi:adenosylmethionine-8-amino-7-oxononanoate aminotransferase
MVHAMSGQSTRSSAVFYRNPGGSLPVIVRGKGYELWDETGHRLIDLASGISTTASIGQGRARVARAMAEQVERLAFIHNSWVTNDRQEELAARYAALSPPGVEKVMFSSGGSEANELSLRIVRQYHLARDEPNRSKVLSLAPSYHGATAGALSVTGRKDVTGDYAPYLFEIGSIPPPVTYRGPFRDSEPKEAAASAAGLLVDAIEAEGPETVAAFIAEPISPSAGMVVPDPSYWREVRRICEDYGILFIADEIVSGAGRCGTFLALDQFGVTADLSNLGKGLTGGYAPLAATLVHSKVADTIEAAGRGVSAVHTYSGNPISCAVGSVVLDIIEEENLFDRAKAMGEVAREMLDTQLADAPMVGEVRGKGLLIGIEYVRSRDSREPFPAEADISRRLWDGMWRRGFLLRTLRHSGILVGDCTNFVPALTIDVDAIEAAVAALRETLFEVAAEL